MAFVPNRRNRPVADAAILDAPVVPYQTNDMPYNHDDQNVEAEYADTHEEFNSFDDPDSVNDILRDKPEQFYVGTVEKKPGKIRARSVPAAIARQGFTLSANPVYFYGMIANRFDGGSGIRNLIYDAVREPMAPASEAVIEFRGGGSNASQYFVPGFPIYMPALHVRVSVTGFAEDGEMNITVFYADAES